MQYQKWRFSDKSPPARPAGTFAVRALRLQICRLKAQHSNGSIQIIRNMVQIPIRPRPLDRLRQHRLITDQVPVGGAGFHDRWGHRLGMLGHTRNFCRSTATSATTTARPAATFAAAFLLLGLFWWC